MKRFPPKKFIKNKPQDMKRWCARVNDRSHDTLILTIWEYYGYGKFGKEGWANPQLGVKTELGSITSSGRIRVYDPVDIWTWFETVDGKSIERVHIARML